jgi:hypothetical protein
MTYYIVRDELFKQRRDAVKAARRVTRYEGGAALIFRVRDGRKQVDSICGHVRGRFLCELPKKHARSWPMQGA